MDFTSNDDLNLDSSIKFELFDVMGVCRTCLCQGLKMNNLFESKIPNICERIQFCTGLKFLKEDPSPENICNVCLDKLNVAYNFKTKCLQSDGKLKTNYSKSKQTLNTNKVYLKENEKHCHNVDDNKEKELVIHNDDIMDSDVFGDVELFKDEQKETLSLIKIEENKVINDTEIKNIIASSHVKADKPDQCLYKSVHQLKDTKRAKFRRLYCEPCNLNFFSKQDSDVHKNTVHKDEAWVCQHCGKSSTKKSAYYYHINSHFKNELSDLHDGKPSARGRNRLGVKRGPYKKKTGITETADCGGSATVGAVKRPRTKFKLNKQFCEKCDVRFENDQEFIAHKRDIHKHIYLCEICGRVFYNRDARFSHMTSHEQPKFACDHCDYTTTRKQDLIKHLYIHNGVKSYQCEYCPLSFYTASNLQHHIRRHRDGPHICNICDKRILDRYSFKRHMDTHNGCVAKIQFACQLCGSCFRRSSRLNQHMLKRHNVRTPPQRPGRRKIEQRDIS